MKTFDDIRNQILEVAQKRFLHYGFTKTTMAEIAKDCDMSAANIYRYFESKKDIAANLAILHFATTERLLETTAKHPGMSPHDKLENMFVDYMKFTYTELVSNPKLSEIVDFVANERWDIVAPHLQKLDDLISSILIEGVATESFEIPDIAATTPLIRMSMIKFYNPIVMSIGGYDTDQLEKAIRGIIRLLVNGLRKR